MITKKNNQIQDSQSLDQRLIEKELLILGKDCLEVSEQDPQKLFEQGIAYFQKGKDLKTKFEKEKAYAFACFYFYFAQCKGYKNARSMRLQAQGELASRYFDAKMKDVLCGRDKLGLSEAKEFIPSVLQNYFDFSKSSFIHVVGIGLYLVPDHIMCALQVMLESGFVFDREMEPEVGRQEMNPLDFIAQSLHRGQGIDCEEYIGEDLADFLLWGFDRTSDKSGFGKDIYGMPSECAYLIGMSYLEGKIVPRDKVQACRFLRYAMLTGSPRACLAWAVYFEEFGYRQENNSTQDLLASYCGTLLHGIMLCALNSNDELKKYSTFVNLKGVQENSNINIEYSLMYSLSLLLAFRTSRLKSLPTDTPIDTVLNLFIHMLSLFGDDQEAEEYLRCSFACLIYACQDDEVHSLRLKLAASSFLLKEEIKCETDLKESYFFIQALLEPLLEKKSELAQKIICYIPVDPDVKVINRTLKELSKHNNANALFKLTTQDNLLNDSADFSPILKLAELGHPVSQYYLSLHHPKGMIPFDTAYDMAMKSLRSGIPMSFFAIYNLLQNSKNRINRQLAYTCLCYASEFILPKSSSTELERVKKEGLYKPLPFMQVIDEIKTKSLSDSTCAVFLGTLYAHGTILPNDQYKAITYFRRAVQLGDLVSIRELSSVYAVNWSVPDNGFILSGMQHALDIMSRFGIGANKVLSTNGKIANRLAKKLYNALKNGHTWLEKNIFDRSKDDAVWRVFEIENDALASSDESNPELFFDSSSEELLNIYAEDQAELYLCDEFIKSNEKHLLDLLNIVSKVHDSSYEKRMTELRVLLSLRGYAGTDANTLCEDILHGANCDSYLCHALYLTDLRPLSMDSLEHNEKVSKTASHKAKPKKTPDREKSQEQNDDGFLDFTSFD